MNHSELRAVSDRLVALIETGQFTGEKRLLAQVWIELASAVRSDLDSEQLSCLETAQLYWSNQAPDSQRIDALKQVSAKLDYFLQDETKFLPHSAMNRLVFCALNTNHQGFTTEIAEYVVEVAGDAGLDSSTLKTILRNNGLLV